MMKTMAVGICCAMLAVNAVHADTSTVVLRDTRQFGEYTASSAGIEGCKPPADPNDVQPGECRVTKAKYVKSGELLTRNVEQGICDLEVYRTVDMRKFKRGNMPDFEVPSTEQRSERFRCDADGARASKS